MARHLTDRVGAVACLLSWFAATTCLATPLADRHRDLTLQINVSPDSVDSDSKFDNVAARHGAYGVVPDSQILAQNGAQPYPFNAWAPTLQQLLQQQQQQQRQQQIQQQQQAQLQRQQQQAQLQQQRLQQLQRQQAQQQQQPQQQATRQQSAQGAQAEALFRQKLLMQSMGFGGIFSAPLKKWVNTPSKPSSGGSDECGNNYSEYSAQQACKSGNGWAADRLQNHESDGAEKDWYDR
nr:hypothetical protein [uncultured Rhodopila sp.]